MYISGNLALYKPAAHTGNNRGQTPDRAVDGSYDQYNCAHPNGDKARWTVDLGDIYRVQRITLYNTVTGGKYQYAKHDHYELCEITGDISI